MKNDSTTCPGDELLMDAALSAAAGTLPSGDVRRAMDHAAGCGACREALAFFSGLRRVAKPAFVSPEILAFAESAARSGMKHLEQIVMKRLDLFERVVPFLLYATRNPQFDTTATSQALGGLLAHPPLFKTYAERVFHYCFETDWGKNPWTNPLGLPAWFDRPPQFATR